MVKTSFFCDKLCNSLHAKNCAGVLWNRYNLQPDNRGEFLLLANKDIQEKYLTKSFLLDKDMVISNISKTKILYLE